MKTVDAVRGSSASVRCFALAALLLLVQALLFPSIALAQASCGLFSPCSGDQVCDITGVCRDVPSRTGQPCGIGVSCASGLSCSASVGGTCRVAEAPRQAGQSCRGLGQGNCANDLACDVSGVCRNVPSRTGQPCGAGVSCASGLSCSAAVGGTCEARRLAGESCQGLGQGNCAGDLVCDFSGECRSPTPRLGEPCGVGVACDTGLACNAEVGGRCVTTAGAGEACTGFGRGTCESSLVCDISGECRSSPPTRGQPCGTGVACKAGLACNALVGGRCGDAATLGERCFGLGQGNCVEGANCNLGSLDGELGQFCFPATTGSLTPEVCRSFYSSALSESARGAGTAITYGLSTSGSAAASGSVGTGVAYGPNGEYGCFDTQCLGAATNVSVGTGVCVGFYNGFDDLPGDSSVLVQSVSVIPGPVGLDFSTSQVFGPIDMPGSQFVGTEDCLSVGASALPLDLGGYNCNTQLTVADDPDSNDDGFPDADTLALNLDPVAPGGDTDGDGVTDAEELGADMTRPRDGDGDGVIDALESGDAAADATVADGTPLGGGRSVTVRTAGGGLLSAVSGSPGDDSAPDDATDVFAVLGYTTTAPVGADVSLTLVFDDALPETLSLYRIDAMGNFSRLPDSAWSRTDATTVALTVTDGDEATDLDDVADGSVTDLIAFGTARADGGSENVGGAGENGNAGGEGGNGNAGGEGGSGGSGDGNGGGATVVDDDSVASGGGGGGGGCTVDAGQRRDPLLPALALFAVCCAVWRRASPLGSVRHESSSDRFG